MLHGGVNEPISLIDFALFCIRVESNLLERSLVSKKMSKLCISFGIYECLLNLDHTVSKPKRRSTSSIREVVYAECGVVLRKDLVTVLEMGRVGVRIG